MDLRKLATALTAALRPVMPSNMQVYTDGATVVVRAEGVGVAGGPTHIDLQQVAWFDLGIVPVPDARKEREMLVGAVLVVLEQVQEFVAEATTEPWPGERSMPPPHASISHGHIHCRYGSAARPVLTLRPIPLATLEAQP